jgi:hypothetical protein
MSVLVPPLTNHHHHHHPPTYFSNNTTRRINGNSSQTKGNRLSLNKCNDNDQNKDHVPYGVVNSMKQRLLNKVNESFLFNQNSTLTRYALSKPSSRLSSNENLLQTKTSLISPLKRTTRLSRSQDNLTNNQQSIANQFIITEQFTSYIQPKQDVIIVDATSNDEENEKLHSGQKTSTHRQSYTELHVDEAPKPGTVTTVKNMFERQIRLSRYDADKLFNSSTPGSSRMSSQHREISSPTRSRSISPNDLLYRQRRTIQSTSILPAPTISLPVPTYPDVVISHTPPAESTKPSNEQIHNENLLINNQGITKEKKLFLPNRNSISHENNPLCVIVDESSSNVSNHQRPNLLLPSISSSETVDCQPLDFKSRLALFNRTNTQQSNENSLNIKKPINPINVLPVKPVIHQSTRLINEEKKEILPETIQNQLSISISRSVVNTAKAVTFFGGDKLNGNTKSSLPKSIAPPPPPILSQKNEQSSPSTSMDLLRTPNVIGGNVKLNKSSIFSGAKKDARVQFIDNVDTFEYPSFEVAMAELGSTGSDDDNNNNNNIEDEDDRSSTSSNDDNNNHKNHLNGKLNLKQEELINNNNHIDDVDDDELERLARINAEFNTNNLSEKPLKPKGTLHTFRPTHLDQYELGTQHGSLPISKSSDILTSKNSYTILARQKLLDTSDTSTKNSIFKPQKSNFDNIQWSSMSTTTDLLF